MGTVKTMRMRWCAPAVLLTILAIPIGVTDHLVVAAVGRSDRPVLAFYYPWYHSSSWCLCQMSDLPTVRYDSSDPATIGRQVSWAAGAGITGFISSWRGAGSTDSTFVRLLSASADLEKTTGQRFASTIYLETDWPAFNTEDKLVTNLRYLLTHYGYDRHFFRWQGRPVIFIWDPLGNGRTLAEWADIRRQMDPRHQSLWSAEGVDSSLLNVFDGLHLFSAGYWGIRDGNMPAVDAGFRAKIDVYNRAHGTQRIWAAGVQPGYDDRKVPGRQNTYVIPRRDGATYGISWTAAIASHPEWITISTWNEWFEGGMIEPSVTYADRYLTLTRQFAQQWRAAR